MIVMETFEIPVGQSQRQLRFVPQGDGLLGTITVYDETRFNFDGIGAFTGQDLQSIAAQIVRHPEFKHS
jgi:hypothetical protein